MDANGNPANQIESETQTNDAYSWDGHSDVTRSYVTNGLNQYTSVSGTAYCYDKNGNLTLDGQYVYLYDVENRLVEMRAKANTTCTSLVYTGQLKAKLRYDALGRLQEVEGFVSGVSQGKQRFLYDGDALVAEYNASGAMLKRYVHGPAAGADDPLIEYAGSGTAAADRRNLYADARGSIVLSTDSAGGAAQINSYDEYGVPGSTNTGRFQYTGQIWLPELGMNYYKARMYSPLLGRFMQTDPIGYEDNVNLYGYVANDPVNAVDPTGQDKVSCTMVDGEFAGCSLKEDDAENTTVTVTRIGSYEYKGETYYRFLGESHSTIEGSLSNGSALGIFGRSTSAVLADVNKIIAQKTGAKRNFEYASGVKSALMALAGVEAGYTYKTPTSGTGKEKSSDVPSWVRANPEYRPRVGETPNATATRVMNDKYGAGNWSRSTGEYSKIQKWAARSFE